GAVQVEVVNHYVALARCGPTGRAADEPDRVPGWGVVVPPLPEGTGGDVQQIGDLGRGVTDGGDVCGHGDGVPAHEVLSASVLQPPREPAAPGRRRCRLGVAALVD